MADEFMKGLSALILGGFGWLVLAGWYNTPEFASGQLITPAPETLTFYDQMGLLLKEGLFYFAILGAFTFWVLIPIVRKAMQARAGQ
ncbi:hypothetical protein ACFQPA_07515 [Halomarina halobia]|uniref:DUF7314 domain-containing protein n=1 Tax=Halomarina halobia TaxID=3033386 RepID=A0ABD6ABW5_9EURY|nr:hypothetical protein [Halomarina sp. PSR21]